MAEVSFSKSELIKKGWGTTKSNYVILLKIALVFILVSIAFNAINIISNNQVGVVSITSLISSIIQTILEIGVIKIGLDIVDGKTPDFKDLYSNYNRFIEFFLTSLIVGIIIVVGFILLIIPGIYFAVRYQFTPYIVVDKKLAYKKAWDTSAEMVKGRWMKVFLFDLSLIGLNILGVLALGVGLFLTIPTSIFASIYLYRKLS
jgi:uncharacterized membrane protein